MIKLIGLGGKLRAGKDAIGDYLESQHGFIKMGMSDALNEALQKIGPKGPWIKMDFTVVIDRPWEAGLRKGKFHAGEFVRYTELLAAVGYVEAKRHEDVRQYLQGLGTEVGREMIGYDTWVNAAENKIFEHARNGKSIVITAIRFPNEVDMLRRLGGLSVWVERLDGQELVGDIGAHKSENSVSQEDFDYVITNHGTLDQLYRKVEKRLVRNEGLANGGVILNTDSRVLVGD